MSEHLFEIAGPLSLFFARELTAVVVDGWVRDEEVTQAIFNFSFAQQGERLEIRACLRHPNSKEPFSRAFTPLYNLMAGLLEAGCQVRVQGDWAQKLPAGQPSPRPLALRAIFQHNLPPSERLPDLNPAQIEEAVTDLPSRHNFTLVGEREFRHANGLSLTVLTDQSHQISGRRPPSSRLMTDSFDRGPRLASSWGEVWIGHRDHRNQGRPAAVHIFPEEIGLVSDVEVYRYRIADRSTLRDLARLDFGQGPPLLHPFDTWLDFARTCGDLGDYALALGCCELAAGCASPEQQARLTQELARWREWQAYVPQAAESGGSVVVRGLNDLVELVGCEERLRAIADSIAWELREAESYHRQPGLLKNLLDYPQLTGRQLLEAGVTPKVMEWLGLGSGPIPPPARYETIFQYRCGHSTLWGTVCSGYLLIPEEPSVLYKAALAK